MDVSQAREIKLFNADTLEYAGSIMISGGGYWEYRQVSDSHLLQTTQGLPLKGVLSCLINYNLVYEIVDCYLE
jgi:hypothetical protein